MLDLQLNRLIVVASSLEPLFEVAHQLLLNVRSLEDLQAELTDAYRGAYCNLIQYVVLLLDLF